MESVYATSCWSSIVTFHFHFQLGWAVYAAQRLIPQHGSMSHPQKIPSKYWVVKIRGRNSKKHNYPTYVYCSLIGSRRSNQAITPLLKKRRTARFNLGSTESTYPDRQLPNQSSPSQPTGRPSGHLQHPSPM